MAGQTLISILSLLLGTLTAGATTVGSKAFTEGYVLGEYAAQVLEQNGGSVSRRFGMGGTGILYQALRAGEIDVYPEYTGTIYETMVPNAKRGSIADLNQALEPLGLVMSEPLGFNNGYALAVTRDFARTHDLHRISDLKRVAREVRLALSSEFVSRADGLSGLKHHYDLPFSTSLTSLEHSLAYEALRKGEADLTDVYTTDAKIQKLDLVVLEDDLHYFPLYKAVWLARREFARTQSREWSALRKVEGHLSEEQMRALNGAVDIEKLAAAEVVRRARGADDGHELKPESVSRRAEGIGRRTREHLVLVGLSLLFSIAVGLPLGILAARRRHLGQGILLLAGTVQTIPSLALLCFLIPVLGIGLKPALAALCLYGLLPVVLNTFVGLQGIDPRLLDTSSALGLGFWDRLLRVELPLASPNILAGIRTSAIVGIGTATLAALIGAGGYGAPIISGLAINDTSEILTGAIPAALMALVAHVLFGVLEHILVPKGLR